MHDWPVNPRFLDIREVTIPRWIASNSRAKCHEARPTSHLRLAE